MNFDSVLSELGDYGFYQLRLYGLLCLFGTQFAFHNLASVFLAATTKFRCAIPGYEGDTYEVQNGTHKELIESFIPLSATGDYETCHVFKNTSLGRILNTTDNSTETLKCTEWVYDTSVFTRTIFTEFNLVCDNAGETTLSTVLFMAGVLVGSFIFGVLSDAIGRKKSFLIGVFLLLVSGVACSFSPNYYVFVALRFIIGACGTGAFLCNYTLGGEIMAPRSRLYAATARGLFFSLGYCILAGLGYLVRDWRALQFYISLPTAWFLLYIWFIPESPRWLLTKGREQEAEKIIRTAEKFNKVTLPDKVFEDIMDKSNKNKILTICELPRELLKGRKLLVRTIIMVFNWLVVSMVYYGLSLNSGNFGGSIFLNFLLGGLIEFPSKLLSLSSQWIGRKASYVIGMLLGGVGGLCSIFVVLYFESNNAALIALSLIGKFGSANGFLLVYFWGSEMYPTVARNSLIGISSVFARVGAMLAPPIGDLSQYITGDISLALPQIIFGSLTIVSTLLSLYLPETKGQPMPETIEDCENFSSGEIGYELKERNNGKSSMTEENNGFDNKNV